MSISPPILFFVERTLTTAVPLVPIVERVDNTAALLTVSVEQAQNTTPPVGAVSLPTGEEP